MQARAVREVGVQARVLVCHPSSQAARHLVYDVHRGLLGGEARIGFQPAPPLLVHADGLVYARYRHFLEVVFPLAALAGIGFVETVSKLNYHDLSKVKQTFFGWFARSRSPELAEGRRAHVLDFGRESGQMGMKRLHTNPLKMAATPALVIYLVVQAYSLHPYQTSYYSEWLGGLKGVAAKNLFDVEFWGTSLKEGSAFLNHTAPPNSLVWVPMAQQVAREYLRPDIIITQTPPQLQKASPFEAKATYLLVFNRYSMLATKFGIYTDLYSIINTQQPTYTITHQVVPILWVFKLTPSD